MSNFSSLKKFSTLETPQTEPMPRTNQVKNNAGGYSFKTNNWDNLNRWIILGSTEGTYYVGEKDLTKQNYDFIVDCLDENPAHTINTIVELSIAGRAFSNDPALFALAVCASYDDVVVRRHALNCLPKVARTGTHLFHFAQYVNNMRGWGRTLVRAFRNWYQEKDPNGLSFQLAKYQQRDGWSHRDILRLCHPRPIDKQHDILYKWAVGKNEPDDEVFGLVKTLELLKKVESEEDVIQILLNEKVQREIIPTEYLKSHKVWELLYPQLGMTALIRNLGSMSANGFLAQGKFEIINNISNTLHEESRIKKERIHPLQVLLAGKTYADGHGYRGKLSWSPVPKMVQALDDLFYLSFKYVEPTNKRLYLGVDISGSMEGSNIAGTPINCRTAAAALAMTALRTEPNCVIKGFTCRSRGYDSDDFMEDIKISPNDSLSTVCTVMSQMNMGGTDCALPMLDALANKIPIDCFIIYTDSETWHGNMHPMEALRKYRREMNIPAKLIVVGMESNGFTIGDPNDKGCLDVVGFDSNIPALISAFVNDEI